MVWGWIVPGAGVAGLAWWLLSREKKKPAIVADATPSAKAAHALFDYLNTNGIDNSPPMVVLVKSFQAAEAKDKTTVGLAGPLKPTGAYDLPTSAALTVYTGQPIPPDPKHQALTFAQALDPQNPGPATIAGTNLYAWIKAHNGPQQTDSSFQSLVRGFQHAVNMDPAFPGGPANPTTDPTVMHLAHLSEDGKYGPATSNALAALQFEKLDLKWAQQHATT